MKKAQFKVGQKVKIISDDEYYADFTDKTLVITHKDTSEKEHRGSDSSMQDMGLYHLVVFNTKEEVPFSVYGYELELVGNKKYYKGGNTSGDWCYSIGGL